MIKRFEKQVVTRKPHICYECKRIIQKGEQCYWFKSVAFKESDIGRNEWLEIYVCKECNEKLKEQMDT